MGGGDCDVTWCDGNGRVSCCGDIYVANVSIVIKNRIRGISENRGKFQSDG